MRYLPLFVCIACAHSSKSSLDVLHVNDSNEHKTAVSNLETRTLDTSVVRTAPVITVYKKTRRKAATATAPEEVFSWEKTVTVGQVETVKSSIIDTGAQTKTSDDSNTKATLKVEAKAKEETVSVFTPLRIAIALIVCAALGLLVFRVWKAMNPIV